LRLREARILTEQKKLRIAYLSGPCDAPAVYDELYNSQRQVFFGSNYVGQFLQLCESIDARALIITNVIGRQSVLHKHRFIIENRPNPSANGVAYHIAMIAWYLRLIPRLISYRPDVLVLTMNDQYWFMLFFMRWLGVSVIPSYHTALWPKFGRPKIHDRALLWLNKWLVLRGSPAIVAASRDIAQQAQSQVAPATAILTHPPTYPRKQFASITPPPAERRPFRLLFAGRIETAKGVYDLLEMARRLETERPGAFCFDLCGSGDELDHLRERIKSLKLEDRVICHGYCDAQAMAPLISACHAWVVPSRTEFPAGYEMVCAEAILSGRPLIASPVCPALADVSEAAIEVEPNNIDQYCDAIKRLYDDPELYDGKRAACISVQEQFYDDAKSWKRKVLDVMRVSHGKSPYMNPEPPPPQ
jgi:glycogen(starch) synthase